MTALRVYLAGPDVFLPDPLALAREKKKLCAQHGFEGVFPLDAELDLADLAPQAAGLRISQANEALIRSCQLLVAHLTPFRGPSADVGTAYEMGFARALGLPIFAYTNQVEGFAERTASACGGRARADGSLEDADGMLIEPFGLADNLMLVGAVNASRGVLEARAPGGAQRYLALAGFEACLRSARALFAPGESKA